MFVNGWLFFNFFSKLFFPFFPACWRKGLFLYIKKNSVVCGAKPLARRVSIPPFPLTHTHIYTWWLNYQENYKTTTTFQTLIEISTYIHTYLHAPLTPIAYRVVVVVVVVVGSFFPSLPLPPVPWMYTTFFFLPFFLPHKPLSYTNLF